MSAYFGKQFLTNEMNFDHSYDVEWVKQMYDSLYNGKLFVPNYIENLNLSNYCLEYTVSEVIFEEPSSVKIIGDYTHSNSGFSNWKALRKITLPNSVTKLESGFNHCQSLSEITLSSALTTLPMMCFYNCKSLPSITIPSSITSFGYNCFGGCDNLTTIIINKPQDSITGAPWGAPNATVIWNG